MSNRSSRSRSCPRTIGTLLASALLAAAAARAAEPARVAYQPRFADAPPARVGQANRSGGSQARVVVIAPEQKAATASATPRLYWYLSADSDRPVEIVVQERGADRPLLEKRLERAGAAGFHHVDLAAERVALEPGREYVWSVALILDPDRRANDLFSMGAMQYVAPAATPPGRGDPAGAVREQLAQGYWYDAIDALERALATAPDREPLETLRRDLLGSQGLVYAR